MTPASDQGQPAGPVTDVPEAAGRRLSGGAWSSHLSVTDFAACVDSAMEPLGFVQGYAVMQWSWFGTRTGMLGGGMGGMGGMGWQPSGRRGQYVEQWRCPHAYVGAEHRLYGVNFEQTWLETSWATGWGLARHRMVEEAQTLGAHGIIGVLDVVKPLVGATVLEFRAGGTAVAVPGVPKPEQPFTTYLAGQRLSKLIEAGFAPVSVVATLAAVQMYGYCITHYQMAGTTPGTWYGSGAGGTAGVSPVEQANRAQAAVRRLAREHVRAQLGSDYLHGAQLEQSEREVGEGDMAMHCILKGNRVRRFKDFDPLAEPAPVVPLT
jgi:hypothetical protein